MDELKEIEKRLASIEAEKLTKKLLNVLFVLKKTSKDCRKDFFFEKDEDLIRRCKAFLKDGPSEQTTNSSKKTISSVLKENIPCKETESPVLPLRSLIPTRERNSFDLENTPMHVPVLKTIKHQAVAESSSIPRPIINRINRQRVSLTDSEISLSPHTKERIQMTLTGPSFSDDLSSFGEDMPFFPLQKKRKNEECTIKPREYLNLPSHVQKRLSINDLEETVKEIKEFLGEKETKSVTKEELEDCISGVYPEDTIKSLVSLGVLKEMTEGYLIE